MIKNGSENFFSGAVLFLLLMGNISSYYDKNTRSITGGDIVETTDNVLLAIKALTDKLGYPPTVREIADASFISISVTHGHLDRLKKRGLVNWVPRSSRTIHLVRPGDRHGSK